VCASQGEPKLSKRAVFSEIETDVTKQQIRGSAGHCELNPVAWQKKGSFDCLVQERFCGLPIHGFPTLVLREDWIRSVLGEQRKVGQSKAAKPS
jgi:hypothetical protein